MTITKIGRVIERSILAMLAVAYVLLAVWAKVSAGVLVVIGLGFLFVVVLWLLAVKLRARSSMQRLYGIGDSAGLREFSAAMGGKTLIGKLAKALSLSIDGDFSKALVLLESCNQSIKGKGVMQSICVHGQVASWVFLGDHDRAKSASIALGPKDIYYADSQARIAFVQKEFDTARVLFAKLEKDIRNTEYGRLEATAFLVWLAQNEEREGKDIGSVSRSTVARLEKLRASLPATSHLLKELS